MSGPRRLSVVRGDLAPVAVLHRDPARQIELTRRPADREHQAYPPLIALDEVPLHGFPLATWHRWACGASPETARGVYPQYDWRCRPCVAMAERRLAVSGDVAQKWRRGPDSCPRIVMLSWLIARSHAMACARLR